MPMSRPHRHVLPLLALLVASSSAAIVPPEAFLPEDVRITAQEMHSFEADGESVSVVVGRFTMRVGGRSFTGRDAVLWVSETIQGRRVLRTIQAYIEGDAAVAEPGGAVTRDRALLVVIHHTGALRASVARRFSEPVTDLPLYQRAVAMRKGVKDGRVPPTDSDVVRPVRPEPTEEKSTDEDARPTERPDVQVVLKPLPAAPIAYRAGETQIRRIPATADQPSRQVTVCRRNVYLFDAGDGGIPGVELQADAAVLFTEDPSADPDEPALGERVGRVYATDAYLEGDVRIASGEHTIRGTRLYFDFITRRAILLDAVYHTIQPQRNVPIYVRANEVRLAASRTDNGAILQEARFRDARVSTSEVYTPTYHVGAHRAVFRDTTLRDATGEPLEESRFDLKTTHSTFNIRGIPVAYLPWTRSNLQDSDVPIRRLQLGDHGRFGFGAESDWRLFRLLGLIEPEGFDAKYELDTYRKATGTGVDIDYARRDYSGRLLAYGVRDHNRQDDFGRARKGIPAPKYRGRWLWRHKQFLPEDWQLQAELSYLCDRNYLEVYNRDEFWSGKPQDTLIYTKKQRDNWAFDVLVQGRINDFLTTTESYPDTAVYLIGRPVLGDALTMFGEAHVGAIRLQAGDEADAPTSSPTTARVDSRVELQWPMHWGPLNVMPYTFGRATYWSRALERNDLGRAIGGGGVKTNVSFWRIYENAHSRLLDVHRLRHVITPEAGFVMMAGNVAADEPHPFSAPIEQRLEAFHGATVGIRQLWQTYRGPEGARRPVDLARLNIRADFFDETKDPDQPSDGRFYMNRPEYSITRNALNGDFAFHISDATAVLGDMNYDLDDREIGLANFGVATQRDPRYRTYLGTRYMDDLNSWVLTAGLNYRLSRKYELAAFQQYDLDFRGGANLQSRVTLIRKLPRWYFAVSLIVDRTTDDVGFVVTLWPEGMPEFRIGGSRVGTWAASEMN